MEFKILTECSSLSLLATTLPLLKNQAAILVWLAVWCCPVYKLSTQLTKIGASQEYLSQQHWNPLMSFLQQVTTLICDRWKLSSATGDNFHLRQVKAHWTANAMVIAFIVTEILEDQHKCCEANGAVIYKIHSSGCMLIFLILLNRCMMESWFVHFLLFRFCRLMRDWTLLHLCRILVISDSVSGSYDKSSSSISWSSSHHLHVRLLKWIASRNS